MGGICEPLTLHFLLPAPRHADVAQTSVWWGNGSASGKVEIQLALSGLLASLQSAHAFEAALTFCTAAHAIIRETERHVGLGQKWRLRQSGARMKFAGASAPPLAPAPAIAPRFPQLLQEVPQTCMCSTAPIIRPPRAARVASRRPSLQPLPPAPFTSQLSPSPSSCHAMPSGRLWQRQGLLAEPKLVLGACLQPASPHGVTWGNCALMRPRRPHERPLCSGPPQRSPGACGAALRAGSEGL